MHFLFLFSLLFYLCHGRMPSSYNETIARHKIVPLCYNLESTTTQTNPKNFNAGLDGCFFNYTFYKYVDAVCDLFTPPNPNITCVSAIWASHDDQAIIMLFRGTTTSVEHEQEYDTDNLTVAFPGGGTVHKFYYNGFIQIWNGGLRDSFFSAKNAYPSYELWVTGLSLGGGLSSIASAYISQMGYFEKANMKVLNFGAMPVGKPDFAARYGSLISYSYRVTHRNDVVPHWFTQDGYVNYNIEVWYNNSMNVGDPYVECTNLNFMNCSGSVPENLWTHDDHNYFAPSRNCVKFVTS